MCLGVRRRRCKAQSVRERAISDRAGMGCTQGVAQGHISMQCTSNGKQCCRRLTQEGLGASYCERRPAQLAPLLAAPVYGEAGPRRAALTIQKQGRAGRGWQGGAGAARMPAKIEGLGEPWRGGAGQQSEQGP